MSAGPVTAYGSGGGSAQFNPLAFYSGSSNGAKRLECASPLALLLVRGHYAPGVGVVLSIQSELASSVSRPLGWRINETLPVLNQRSETPFLPRD